MGGAFRKASDTDAHSHLYSVPQHQLNLFLLDVVRCRCALDEDFQMDNDQPGTNKNTIVSVLGSQGALFKLQALLSSELDGEPILSFLQYPDLVQCTRVVDYTDTLSKGWRSTTP
jgi:hypothetical protein